MNILNNKYESSSRFKLKQIDKMTIYDVFIIKMLADTTDKLYLYVDDRSLTPCLSQKMIDDIMNVLRMFNIKLPDVVIRYTDYYDTAWVYLHRLLTINRAVLNYNIINKTTDLDVFSKTQSVKVFYNNNTLQSETSILNVGNNSQSKIIMQNVNRYDNILYDCGWFRDVFIEIIIDHCEKIDKYVDENNDTYIEQSQKINMSLIAQLRSALKFKEPEKVLTELTVTIKNMKNKYIPDKIRISDIPLNYSHEIGVDMQMVRKMIEKDDDTLMSYAYDINKNCRVLLSDPIKIILSKQKNININGKTVIICGIFIDSIELLLLGLNSQKLNQMMLHVESVGYILLNLCNAEYVGTFINLKKKKRRNIKRVSKWLPITVNLDERFVLQKLSIYDSDDSSETNTIKRNIMMLKHEFKTNLCILDSNVFMMNDRDNISVLIPISKKIKKN